MRGVAARAAAQAVAQQPGAARAAGHLQVLHILEHCVLCPALRRCCELRNTFVLLRVASGK